MISHPTLSRCERENRPLSVNKIYAQDYPTRVSSLLPRFGKGLGEKDSERERDIPDPTRAKFQMVNPLAAAASPRGQGQNAGDA